MPEKKPKKIGFACAYTPLPLIDAAGFAPYRILPTGNWPDQAGRFLHDNLCPHVKRILDRALDHDLPADLSGTIFMNSCDAMRRLYDAWRKALPDENAILIDLPVAIDDSSINYFSKELYKLMTTLSKWGKTDISIDAVNNSMARYIEISNLFDNLKTRLNQGASGITSASFQELVNRASTGSFDETINLLKNRLQTLEKIPVSPPPSNKKTPLFVFGNILPDLEAFTLIESCGGRIVGEDFCTGARMFGIKSVKKTENPFDTLARCLLSRPPCARTIDCEKPGTMPDMVLEQAKQCNAKGVIGHTIKFCDPYLTRLSGVRETMKNARMPILILEGDCTMRSMEQQRTRIEAFIEMLR